MAHRIGQERGRVVTSDEARHSGGPGVLLPQLQERRGVEPELDDEFRDVLLAAPLLYSVANSCFVASCNGKSHDSSVITLLPI